MAFTFDDMHSELSELMLIQVQNIDVLKSRSQLFRNILCEHDNTDNSWINVEYHVNYLEHSHWSAFPIFLPFTPNIRAFSYQIIIYFLQSAYNSMFSTTTLNIQPAMCLCYVIRSKRNI